LDATFCVRNSAFAARHRQFHNDFLDDRLLQCHIHRLAGSPFRRVRRGKFRLDHENYSRFG
jgi:hypothetical protein